MRVIRSIKGVGRGIGDIRKDEHMEDCWFGGIYHWNCHGSIRNVWLENGHGWAVYLVLVQVLRRFQCQGYICIDFSRYVRCF